MARKNIPPFITDGEDFPSVLRYLMDNGEKKTTQGELAEAIGVTRQTISLYTTGQSSPDWKKLRAIAEHFNVSTDYLVGLSEIPPSDPDIIDVCKFTGLSPKTAFELHVLNCTNQSKVNFISHFLDKIVTHQYISSLERLIRKSADALYIASSSLPLESFGSSDLSNMMFTENKGTFALPAIEAAEYYKISALNKVSQKIDEVFRDIIEELCEEANAPVNISSNIIADTFQAAEDEFREETEAANGIDQT